MVSKRFAIIGVAGYIARRHLEAIRSVGGEVVAAFDVFDSVGQMNDFAKAKFFTDFTEFESFVLRSRREGRAIDYVTICSPNYLHRAHIEFALRAGADAICEKPLVLEPWEIDELTRLERETGRRLYTILQLRLNPDNVKLKADFSAHPAPVVGDLTYITARSQWYYASWKGDERKSGGLATNIGVHFFDLLADMFGSPVKNEVHYRAPDCASGKLTFSRASIRWLLSINARDLPADALAQKELNKATRRLVVGDRVCDLSGDFTRLHTLSYEEILAGRGFGLDTARTAVEIVSQIRTAVPDPRSPDAHPLIAKIIADKSRYENGLPII